MRTADRQDFLHASCRLLQESLQLPAAYCLISQGHEVHDAAVGAPGRQPLCESRTKQIQDIVKKIRLQDVPVIHTTCFGESFVVVPWMPDGAADAAVVIGPAAASPMTDEIIQSMLDEFHITERSEWFPYLKRLPFATFKRLYHIAALVHHHLNGVLPDMTAIKETHDRRRKSADSPAKADIVISDRRESRQFRDIFEIEKQLLRSIRNGDKTAFYNMTLAVDFDDSGILTIRNPLRNIKNLGIYVIALAARAGIEGGLYPEVAYALSDLHIQHIEELRDHQAVVNAIGEALADFIDRVSRSKRKHLSKPVAACQEYIFNHLYEPITLSALAEKTGLQANYLSQLFKKETGVTITQFIQREKVEEAKKLLELTQEPIAAIAAKLNFYDQNHFIKIFKRYTGLTPKRYRNKNLAHESAV